jgi:hypothetical protein
VASDAGGDFVVTWSRRGPDGYDTVRARRFSSAGIVLTDELQVNVYTPVWRPFPVVASDADGDFVVAWKRLTSTEFPSYYHIAGRRFTSAGVASRDEFQVNTQTIHYLIEPFPSVASDAAGDFVVAWTSLTAGDYEAAVLGRRFSSTAAPLASVFEVNAQTTTVGNDPWVTALPAGGFIVTWNGFLDGSDEGILARRFTSAGTPLAVELQVNTYTPATQSIFRSVAANAAGQFVVTWGSRSQDGSDSGVFGQRFALPTLTATPTLTASATPTITLTPTNSATSLPAADLYAIPTLSRVALAILVVLLSAIAIVFLLARPSGAR